MDIRSVNTTQPNPTTTAPVSVGQKIADPPSAANANAQTSAAAAAVADAQPAPTLAQITQAVNSLNQAMSAMSSDLQFSVDEDSQKTVIKVIDQKTKEVIRQIPSVEALAIAKALDQAQGLLIKQKA